MPFIVFGPRKEQVAFIGSTYKSMEQIQKAIDFIRTKPFSRESAQRMVMGDKRLNVLLGPSYEITHEGHFLHPNLKDFHFFSLRQNGDVLGILPETALTLVWRNEVEINPKNYPSMLDGYEKLSED